LRLAYDELTSNPRRFGHLDAAQLVKHALGLRHTFPEVGQVILLYLYWELLGAAGHQEFVSHRREVSEFAEWVGDGDVRFESMAYPDLWSHWEERETWEGMTAHVSALRERYGFDV
jgi:hypothetical protein